MKSLPERNLKDMALARLRSLFGERYLREMIEPKPAADRCKIKACVYPAARDGLCRRHFLDLSMQASAMPSTTGTAMNGYDHTVAA